GNGGIDEQSGQGNEVNDGVDGVPDFSTIIAQQLQNLLSTILAQVGNQGSNQGNTRNQNGDAINDNIKGDVRNVIVNNGRRGCGNKYSLKDKNEAKTDKTEHENGNSMKSQNQSQSQSRSQRRVHGPTRTQVNGPGQPINHQS
ncbi:hypothetical protein Tco_0338234, partial [Tanacetum coccineum]